MHKQVYTGANGMVWEYVYILDRIANDLNSNSDKTIARQNVLLCILLSVVVVETFLNQFFQDLVLKAPYRGHKVFISNGLKSRLSIDRKIKRWPEKVLGNKLNIETGIGKQFIELKDLRNRLMHFSMLGNVNIDGKEFDAFSDISFYESLKISDALNASNVAEETIYEILMLSGFTGDTLKSQFLKWTGKRHV